MFLHLEFRRLRLNIFFKQTLLAWRVAEVHLKCFEKWSNVLLPCQCPFALLNATLKLCGHVVDVCSPLQIYMLAVNLFTFDPWAGLSCRKLEEVHNNFMDEKDRVITEIYNTSKERARWRTLWSYTCRLRRHIRGFEYKSCSVWNR